MNDITIKITTKENDLSLLDVLEALNDGFHNVGNYTLEKVEVVEK